MVGLLTPLEREWGIGCSWVGDPHVLLSDQCSLRPILPVKGEGDRLLGCWCVVSEWLPFLEVSRGRGH